MSPQLRLILKEEAVAYLKVRPLVNGLDNAAKRKEMVVDWWGVICRRNRTFSGAMFDLGYGKTTVRRKLVSLPIKRDGTAALIQGASFGYFSTWRSVMGKT